MAKEKIPEKQYYDIKLTALVPCELTYRIYATDENEALKEVEKKAPTNIKHNIHQKRPLKAIVYSAGSTMIKLIKNFRF